MGWLRRLSRGVRHVAGVRWDLVAGASGLILLVAVILLLAVTVFVPQQLIEPRGLSRTEWLTHVESLRATILQTLGGLALLGTLYFTARTLRLNRRGQLTERFSKAIEQLGSDSLAVRLGGVYALEQIAFDSAELHWPVMEVLSAYVRQHAPTPEDKGASKDNAARRTPADHQAIATVIGRRRAGHDPDGQHLDLNGAHLDDVSLAGAHLEKANLREAHLEGADLFGTHLQSANLLGAHLEDAALLEAHLEGANLLAAHLEGAKLLGAHLEGAKLRGAHLDGAALGGTSAEVTFFGGARLDGADLRGTHGLTLEQLLGAVGARQAHLPDDLARRLDEVTETPG